MSNADDGDLSEKTNIFNTNTVRIKVDADYKVPPCLVLLVGPTEQMGKQWVISRPTMTIGRSPDADIHISEASLSKNHARIELTSSQVTITDLGSTNQTSIDDKQLTPHQAQPLKNNDHIRCANLVFKFLERGILSETSEKERMQSELEGARNVQEVLFPKNTEAVYQWVQIGGQYRSASECGGDWWWHWSCGNKAFALIADATGHGAAAALMTSAARSAIATIEDNASIGLEKVYATLSHAIHKCSGGKLTMSAFIVEVDLATRKIRYINASHLPAVLLPHDTSQLNWKTLRYLIGATSAPLGAPAQKVLMTETVATPQTRLVLLTDGITERLDSNGKMLNERNFGKMLLDAHSMNPHMQKDFLKELLRRSDQLANSAALADDITVVALDFI
jgi:serine phosphatase RsbU (regulator of sigma subunit)